MAFVDEYAATFNSKVQKLTNILKLFRFAIVEYNRKISSELF